MRQDEIVQHNPGRTQRNEQRKYDPNARKQDKQKMPWVKLPFRCFRADNRKCG
jgi:hypothetical protein